MALVTLVACDGGSYVLGEADVGATLTVTASYTDGQGTAESVISVGVGPVANVNDAPTISGIPGTLVAEGNPYSFTPTANDVDVGDTLTFNISHTPDWASFDEVTGTLSGTPSNSDVGIIGGLVISVSDGEASASLPVFSIVVSNTRRT